MQRVEIVTKKQGNFENISSVLLYLNFNLDQYVRKKLHINSKNLVRFFRNLASKLVQEH